MFDIETLIDTVTTTFQSGFAAEVTAINSEKGDSLLSDISSEAWFFQNLNEDVWNYEQFIIYGLSPTQDVNDSIPGNYIKTVNMFYEVVIQEDGSQGDDNQFKKLLRYSRVFETLAFKNFDSIQGHAKIKVTSLAPTSFSLDGKFLRSAGINLTASITAY